MTGEIFGADLQIRGSGAGSIGDRGQNDSTSSGRPLPETLLQPMAAFIVRGSATFDVATQLPLQKRVLELSDLAIEAGSNSKATIVNVNR